MTVFEPHKPLQKDPSENLPRSDLDPKIFGGYSIICLAIRSPMYWECRNRYPRADLHTVLVSTMSQITAILFCLCDWQLSGLHPLTKEKRARQHGVSSETCRHRQAWLKQRLTPISVATNLIVYQPMSRTRCWNNAVMLTIYTTHMFTLCSEIYLKHSTIFSDGQK